MLSKTIVAALLATTVVALPANDARDSRTKRDPNSLVTFYIPGTEPVEKREIGPEWISDPKSLDHPRQPSGPVKRDLDSLIEFYIPDAPAPDVEEEVADLDKRFYIYHRPPPGPEQLDKESDGAVEEHDIEPN